VRFIDPEGEVVGRQALNDHAQKILDDAPADFVLEEDGLVGPLSISEGGERPLRPVVSAGEGA
jgi:hypothetical protein